MWSLTYQALLVPLELYMVVMSVYQIPHSKYDTLCTLHIFLTLVSYTAVCHIMLCVKLYK